MRNTGPGKALTAAEPLFKSGEADLSGVATGFARTWIENDVGLISSGALGPVVNHFGGPEAASTAVLGPGGSPGEELGKLLASPSVMVGQAGLILLSLQGGASSGPANMEWPAVRARLGQQLQLPKHTQVHHWLIPQGGTGRITLRGILGNQWGRFFPAGVRNGRWNLMVPPAHAQGYASRAWHAGLHGQGQFALGLGGRLWYGSPTWAKVLVGGVPLAAGAATYALESK